MSNNLISTLDAMANERPLQLKNKSRHFNVEQLNAKRATLNWMRLNAERDRIEKFKVVAMDNANFYYKILQDYVKVITG